MTITVSDFQRITGVSRHTVYSWIYRNKMPKGMKLAGIGKSKILKVSRDSEYFEELEKQMA